MLSGTLPAVICYWCLRDWRARPEEERTIASYQSLGTAVTVQGGNACCMEHIGERDG